MAPFSSSFRTCGFCGLAVVMVGFAATPPGFVASESPGAWDKEKCYFLIGLRLLVEIFLEIVEVCLD